MSFEVECATAYDARWREARKIDAGLYARDYPELSHLIDRHRCWTDLNADQKQRWREYWDLHRQSPHARAAR